MLLHLPRLPVEPLYDYSGAAREAERWRVSQWAVPYARARRHASDKNAPAAASILADKLGLPRRTVQAWAVLGVPLYSADEAATALGYHPSHIWGDDWWAACFDASVIEEERREATRLRALERRRAQRRAARAVA